MSERTFKGAEAGEVYDILVMCLLKAINKWDPHYTDKVRQVVDVISERFFRKQFTAYQLNSELGFNGTSICRMLARRGFLPEPGGGSRLAASPVGRQTIAR